jgi:outer membrane protein
MQSRVKKSMLLATLMAASLVFVTTSVEGADPATPSSVSVKGTDLKVGVVNFRKVVENSKQGKQQQATFEGMKSQMESLLQEKEKSLKEIASKLNDQDYLDGLTPEAENDLKFKYRSLSQEMAQSQQQFLQSLQQANVKIVQMLTEEVSKVAGEVAQAKNLDIVLNEDSAFYAKSALDLSDKVVQKMNENFEREAKKRETVTDAQKH